MNKYNFEKFVFSLNLKNNAINVNVSNTPGLVEKLCYDFKVVDIKNKFPAVSDIVEGVDFLQKLTKVFLLR